MATPIACNWSGVFPAATTQFDESLNVDLTATKAVQAALIRDGVHGMVVLGTVGENNSLSADEKRSVLKAAVEIAELATWSIDAISPRRVDRDRTASPSPTERCTG